MTTRKSILTVSILITFGICVYHLKEVYENEKATSEKIIMTEGRYEFIVRIMPTVDDFCREIPVDKWCLVTQICHETNFGRSRIAKENNNLFGIRQDGRYAYFDSPEDCLRRWYQILAYSGNKHYRRALECMYKNDYEGYFRHIQRGGWAADKK